MLEGGVGGEDGVVGLHDGSGSLGSRVDTELQLALLAVVDGETLHQESTETRAGTTTEGVEDEEALETNTVVGNTANLVEDAIDELLADGVVTTSVVVGSILLAGDHHLGVEEVSVSTSSDLIDNVGLEIAVDGTGDVLALTWKRGRLDEGLRGHQGRGRIHTSLGEESAEALIGVLLLALLSEVAIGLEVGRRRSVRDEVVLSTKECVCTWIPCSRQYSCRGKVLAMPSRKKIRDRKNTYLPAGVGDLATGLADWSGELARHEGLKHDAVKTRVGIGGELTVDANDLTHGCGREDVMGD